MVRPLHAVRGIDDLTVRSPDDEHQDARTIQHSHVSRSTVHAIASGGTQRQRQAHERVAPGSTPDQIAAIVEASLLNPETQIVRDSFPARYRRAKRLFDLLIASVGLVIAAPLIALLGVLVRLDSPGPAFFLQTRVGYRGRLFSIIKLRTMTHQIDHAGETDRAGDGRVTRIGSYLRRWSLDELPQLINVVRGQMSLVGPRPELPEVVLERYADWQYQRFLVPQGMTGWWQITERGTTRLCDDTEDDLAYLERASILVDLQILWMTLPAVIRQAGVL